MKLMRLLYMLCLGLMVTFLSPALGTTHTITNDGFNFVPMQLDVEVGDTVIFDIGSTHNAVEVSEATYNNRGTASNGGFEVGFGGGIIVIEEAKTYYYVCTPHASLDMVGTIFASEAQNADAVFVADLSGSNEVLPILSGASGQVTASLFGDTLVVEGAFSGMTGEFNFDIAGGSHLHRGFAGQNGPVDITLVPTLDEDQRGGIFEAENNTFVLSDTQLTWLSNREYYVNIHSTTFPGGELRGQLLPPADAYYAVNLFGSNEVPAIISQANGAFVMDLSGDTLHVSGAVANLSSSINTAIGGGAHLHIGMAGENGPVEIPLVFAFGEDSTEAIINNDYILTPAQTNMLNDRMLYVNFHSLNFPAGELRGQVRAPADAIFRVNLLGANEVNSVTTAATGGLVLELEDSILTVTGSFSGLSSDLATDIMGGAHIHLGPAGQNGPIEFVLEVTQNGNPTTGAFLVEGNQFVLNDAQIANLLERQYYVNVHSENFQGGELRGQIVPESQFFMTGFLTGMQETDPVVTGGSGAVVAEINGDQLRLSGSFNNLDAPLDKNIMNGSHLHTALAGANGPIEFVLEAELTDGDRTGVYQAGTNRFTLTEGLLDTLIQRGFYVNIHSEEVASGELRAQLVHEATAYFYAPLSGAGEANPVNTSANGALIAEWNSGQMVSTGAFSGLESAFNTDIAGGAHLHFGLSGQNGPVIYLLNATTNDDNTAGEFRLENNQLALSEDFPDTILSRQVYVNIHSVDNPSGEIRGQLLPYANVYLGANLSGLNEVPPVLTTGMGGFSLELNGNQLAISGHFEDLESDYDPNVMGGSHLHLGPVGQNGGIEFILVPNLDDDNLGGSYFPVENTFQLEDNQLVDLLAGNYYFNIHTVEVGSGELRGQVLTETNDFPISSTITAPASGTPFTLEGAGTTPFQASWTEGSDPEGQDITYVWQLAADPNFNNPVVVVNRGDTTSFTTDFLTVSQILQDAGVNPGQTIRLYHRVLTTDGSVLSTGQADSLDVTLGVVTSNNRRVLETTEFSTYPNPVVNVLTVNIEVPEAYDSQLFLVDAQGRMLQRREAELRGGNNQFQLDVSRLQSGIYFVQLWTTDQKLVNSKRIIIR